MASASISVGNVESLQRQRLKIRHEALDEQILAEMRKPLPDWLEIQRLKKKKLLLKEQIEAIQ